eukprot:jgi/Picsp_1/1319/NSC_04800-R1_protein
MLNLHSKQMTADKYRGNNMVSRSKGILTAKSDILRQAAWAVDRLVDAQQTERKGISLKSSTLGKGVSNKRAVYAVTVETLKYYKVLENLITIVGLDSTAMSPGTCCVLAREIVMGSGVSRIGKAEKLVLDMEEKMKKALQRMITDAGVTDVSELLPRDTVMEAAQKRKRILRVNTIKCSIEMALESLQKTLSKGVVERNKYIPEVLELPSGTDLHAHHLVENGSVVLQSFASCLPAFIMDPEPEWNIVDACAAPGNKTTHLAAILSSKAGQQGKPRGAVIAFDRDKNRLNRLELNIKNQTASDIITAKCCDFLQEDPAAHKDVDAILLDPSCSGSGTRISRMDYLLPSDGNLEKHDPSYVDDRIQQLSEFQKSALCHAFSFPRVKRIVYSTCSIYDAENEGVVASVLDKARDAGFVLEPAMPKWHRRGNATSISEDEAEKVLRVDPLEDGTDGFFVALFKRDN